MGIRDTSYYEVVDIIEGSVPGDLTFVDLAIDFADTVYVAAINNLDQSVIYQIKKSGSAFKTNLVATFHTDTFRVRGIAVERHRVNTTSLPYNNITNPKVYIMGTNNTVNEVIVKVADAFDFNFVDDDVYDAVALTISVTKFSMAADSGRLTSTATGKIFTFFEENQGAGTARIIRMSSSAGWDNISSPDALGSNNFGLKGAASKTDVYMIFNDSDYGAGTGVGILWGGTATSGSAAELAQYATGDGESIQGIHASGSYVYWSHDKAVGDNGYIHSSSDDVANSDIVATYEVSSLDRTPLYIGAGETDGKPVVYVAKTFTDAVSELSNFDASATGDIDTYQVISSQRHSPGRRLFGEIVADSDGVVYCAGSKFSEGGSNIGNLFAIRPTTNSVSIGPSTFAPSVGYAVGSDISGSTISKHSLGNISEFPHSSGIFQMPNLLLGTIDSGQVGKGEDAIIQVKHFGSVVNVMWPKQGDQNTIIAGFGDVSPGVRPGNLSTVFEPGDLAVTDEYDHLALYCYALKNVSGTLDNIEIKLERRPLKGSGFATQQSMSSSFSGNFTVETLTDLTYKKEINYGDLSIKELAFPIDVPLVNTKEIRVSARQTEGQSDDKNRNLIIWGRLIKSEEET